VGCRRTVMLGDGVDLMVTIDGLSNIEVVGDVCDSHDWLRKIPLG